MTVGFAGGIGLGDPSTRLGAGGSGCDFGGWETAGALLMDNGFGTDANVAIGADFAVGLAINGLDLLRNNLPKKPGCLTGFATDGGADLDTAPGTYRAKPGLSFPRFFRSSSSFFLNSSGRSEIPSAIGATVKNHEHSIPRPTRCRALPILRQR